MCYRLETYFPLTCIYFKVKLKVMPMYTNKQIRIHYVRNYNGIRKKPGTEHCHTNVISILKHGGDSIMLLGCFPTTVTTTEARVEAKINAESYLGLYPTQ